MSKTTIDLTKPMRMKSSKNPVRVLCTDRACSASIIPYTHIVLMKHPEGYEEIRVFTLESFLDNVENVPVKKSVTSLYIRNNSTKEVFIAYDCSRQHFKEPAYTLLGQHTFEYEE